MNYREWAAHRGIAIQISFWFWPPRTWLQFKIGQEGPGSFLIYLGPIKIYFRF